MIFFARLEKRLLALEKGILVFLFSILILLSFTQVILRTFFSTGILWADVFLRHSVLWVGFLGAAIATAEDKHFLIDVFKKFLPPAYKKAAEVLIDLFAIACLYFLSGAAVKFLQDEAASKSVLFSIGEFQVPGAWVNCIIPLAFVLLLIHFAFQLINDTAGLFKKADAQRP